MSGCANSIILFTSKMNLNRTQVCSSDELPGEVLFSNLHLLCPGYITDALAGIPTVTVRRALHKVFATGAGVDLHSSINPA